MQAKLYICVKGNSVGWTISLGLCQEVMDYLSNPGHQITLLAAHDNMMTAFLVALKIYKEQWPLYASMVLWLSCSRCLGGELGQGLRLVGGSGPTKD